MAKIQLEALKLYVWVNYVVIVESSGTIRGICRCQKREIHSHQHAVQLSAIEENEK